MRYGVTVKYFFKFKVGLYENIITYFILLAYGAVCFFYMLNNVIDKNTYIIKSRYLLELSIIDKNICIV